MADTSGNFLAAQFQPDFSQTHQIPRQNLKLEFIGRTRGPSSDSPPVYRAPYGACSGRQSRLEIFQEGQAFDSGLVLIRARTL